MKATFIKHTLFKAALCGTSLFMALGGLHTQAAVTLESDQRIGMEGLYFWYSDPSKPVALFNREVTPKGSCFTIVNGYAFLVWYKGGMTVRNLMLSRQKIGTTTWKTIQFPETNTLWNRLHESAGIDYSRSPGGDSHRTAAIAVSVENGTIHIFHDAHVSDLRYRLSKDNIAFAPDSEFTLANFNPERNYLRPGEPMNSFTYPDVAVSNAGDINLAFRVGTSRQGDLTTTHYNGSTWSPVTTLIKGNDAVPQQFNLYGGISYQQGKMYVAGTVRVFEDPIDLNQNIYYAEADQTALGPWKTAAGASFSTPVRSLSELNRFKIAEPVRDNNDKWGSAPSFAVSDSGTAHFTGTVRGQPTFHYFKTKTATTFTKGSGGNVPGNLDFSSGGRIYGVSLNNGDLELRSSPENGSSWRTDFTYSGTDLAAASYQVYEGKLYVIAAESIQSDKRPFRQIVLDLGGITTPASSAAASSRPASSRAASSRPASSTPASSRPASSRPASSRSASSVAPSSTPASSRPASSRAASSTPSTACVNTINVTWDTRAELTVNTGTCIAFDRNLSGNDVQVWDSDTNTSCDYRGTLTSVDGSGSLAIDSNYVTTTLLTGTKFKFTNSGSCTFVKVRAY